MPLQFYVDKANGTFADSLTAFGLARILRDLVDVDDGSALSIHNKGSYYAIDIGGIPEFDLASLVQYQGKLAPASLVRTVKNTASLPADYPDSLIFDYKDEKLKRNMYLEFIKKARSSKTPTDQKPPLPHPHWDIYRAINPAALPGYNNLLCDWWSIRDAHPQVLELLLRLFSSTPNDVDAAIKEWKALDKAFGWGIDPETTTLQLYNPDQGKGQNRGKANALGMGNVKGFWLLEWLKAVGFFHAALTQTLRGVKDRKTYVLAPVQLDFDESNSVLDHFRAMMQFSKPAITSDILASIYYTRALLLHADERRDFLQMLLDVGDGRPRNVVAGFYTAFYKDLGNAVATMNLSFIALPGWIRVRDGRDVEQAEQTIAELKQLLWTMDESHSDAYTLLDHLRDFISGDNLDAFFAFTSAYPAYLIGRRERNQPARQLTTDFVRRVIVGTDEGLSAIFESEGFKNIAYAIRQSTVTAQYRKMHGDRRYDVRYGLGQDLARKARYPSDFLVALTDFLHKYNAETVQVMEREKQRSLKIIGRRRVKTTDIEEVVALIDRYGATLIGNLLIAYGYARMPDEEDSSTDIEMPMESFVYDDDADSALAGEE